MAWHSPRPKAKGCHGWCAGLTIETREGFVDSTQAKNRLGSYLPSVEAFSWRSRRDRRQWRSRARSIHFGNSEFMSDYSGYSTQDSDDLSDSDGGDLSDRSVAEDEIEEIRDGIGLLATCSAAAFEAAVSHLPPHLQNNAFRARQHLRAVSSAIDSRRIKAAVCNEMEQLLPMTTLPAQSAATDPGSRLGALPTELQACVYAAAWCKSISELPLACLAQICEAAWRGRNATQVCGRLACVAHRFRVDSLLGRLAEARDEWISCWICVTGLPVCDVPEQGRRIRQLSRTLFELQHKRAAALYPQVNAQHAIQQYWDSFQLGSRTCGTVCLPAHASLTECLTVPNANVASEFAYMHYCTAAFTAELIELASTGLSADDDHYTLGLPTIFRRKTTATDPPPEPLARHALAVRRACKEDLPVLTDRSRRIRVSPCELQRQCTAGGIWCPEQRATSRLRALVARAAE